MHGAKTVAPARLSPHTQHSRARPSLSTPLAGRRRLVRRPASFASAAAMTFRIVARCHHSRGSAPDGRHIAAGHSAWNSSLTRRRSRQPHTNRRRCWHHHHGGALHGACGGRRPPPPHGPNPSPVSLRTSRPPTGRHRHAPSPRPPHQTAGPPCASGTPPHQITRWPRLSFEPSVPAAPPPPSVHSWFPISFVPCPILSDELGITCEVRVGCG